MARKKKAAIEPEDLAMEVVEEAFAERKDLTGSVREQYPLMHVTCVLMGMIEALTARVAELEARPDLKYIGTWIEGTEYRAGNAVTFDGSVWVAIAAKTTAKPGPSADWRLAVKGVR